MEKLAVKANSATEQLHHAQSQARSFDDPSSAIEALKEKVRCFLSRVLPIPLLLCDMSVMRVFPRALLYKAKSLYTALQLEQRKSESLEKIIQKSKRTSNAAARRRRLTKK